MPPTLVEVGGYLVGISVSYHIRIKSNLFGLIVSSLPT